jgi:fibronectin type 3 domain-containing protein
MYLDPNGTGAWTSVANLQFTNRDYGCSVLYDDGKVVFFGGGDPPTDTAEVIDLNAATPAWRYTQSGGTQTKMLAARRQINATLLPDGKVLITGGVSGAGFNNMSTPVYAAEIWDPATEQFTPVAGMRFGRWYHSTVVLLPDGRILSAGGDNPTSGANPSLATEIYSPPYLFKGARPSITSAPESVSYGQTFAVTTPDAAGIANVNWIRLSSVTHSNNMDQRINRLAFSRTASGLSVTAPSNPNLCPPGYYMLFLLNGQGVPSVAKLVRIGVQQPLAPSALSAAAGDARVTLQWSAGPGATGYKVKRSTTSGGPYVTVASGVATTRFEDTGVTNGTTYYYVVSGTNAHGESPDSNQASATPVAPAPVGTGTGLRAEYFDNIDLTGLKLARTDAAVDFDWGTGSPDPAIAPDTFSARWSGQVEARYTQTYTFTTTSDDGVRLWVNGQLLINNWTDHAPTANSATLALTAGQRVEIRMEFYENGGGAVARLEWQSASQPRQVVPRSQLYPPAVAPAAPSNLTASAASSSQINLSWSDNSGDEQGFKVERAAGADATAAFAQVATVGANATNYSDTGLAAGTAYTYRVRAYNAAGDSPYSNTASATTQAAGTPAGTGTGLRGEYFDKRDFTNMKFARTDATVNFDWGTGSPASAIAPDTFSVRWTGKVEARYSQTYTFYTRSDDGVRLWVNGQLIINNWTDHAPTTNSGTITLSAGQKVDIRIDYYENGGGAVARLEWQSPSQPRQVIPKTQLYPPTTTALAPASAVPARGTAEAAFTGATAAPRESATTPTTPRVPMRVALATTQRPGPTPSRH